MSGLLEPTPKRLGRAQRKEAEQNTEARMATGSAGIRLDGQRDKGSFVHTMGHRDAEFLQIVPKHQHSNSSSEY